MEWCGHKSFFQARCKRFVERLEKEKGNDSYYLFQTKDSRTLKCLLTYFYTAKTHAHSEGNISHSIYSSFLLLRGDVCKDSNAALENI